MPRTRRAAYRRLRAGLEGLVELALQPGFLVGGVVLVYHSGADGLIERSHGLVKICLTVVTVSTLERGVEMSYMGSYLRFTRLIAQAPFLGLANALFLLLDIGQEINPPFRQTGQIVA
jgi:hypothetical protein